MVLPFGWSQFQAIDWALMPMDMYWKIGFVVVFSTFFTYLLNLLSMRELKPTTVAVFVYLQPFFATVFAISLRERRINFGKNNFRNFDIYRSIFGYTKEGLIFAKSIAHYQTENCD